MSELLREHRRRYAGTARQEVSGVRRRHRRGAGRGVPDKWDARASVSDSGRPGLHLAQAGALDRDRFSEVTLRGQPYRVLARPFSSDAQRLVLFVAAPLEGNRAVLRAFSAGLLWTIPALIALSALGGYVLSRRALKPVDQITAATRSISVSNLSGRLPVPETRDELQRLSETCNEMLARLESAVNEIKRFTADASHELRNPVSFVRTTAELALRNRQMDATSRRAFEEIVAECGKASRLLKDMLTLARADAGNSRLAFEPVDLVEVVKAGCQKARLLADAHGHTLTISVEDGCQATVWGDYSGLHRLLWILLDNAVKYTRAPGSHKGRAGCQRGEGSGHGRGQWHWNFGGRLAAYLRALLSRGPVQESGGRVRPGSGDREVDRRRSSRHSLGRKRGGAGICFPDCVSTVGRQYTSVGNGRSGKIRMAPSTSIRWGSATIAAMAKAAAVVVLLLMAAGCGRNSPGGVRAALG